MTIPVALNPIERIGYNSQRFELVQGYLFTIYHLQTCINAFHAVAGEDMIHIEGEKEIAKRMQAVEKQFNDLNCEEFHNKCCEIEADLTICKITLLKANRGVVDFMFNALKI